MGSHRRSSDRKGSGYSSRSSRSHRSHGRSRSYDRYNDEYDYEDDRYRPRRPNHGMSGSSSWSAPPASQPVQNPLANLSGMLSEEPEQVDDKRGSAPPTYDESQAGLAKSSDPEAAKEPAKKEKKRTLGSWWSLAPVLPLLTGVLLLFIITCSTSDLRADFGVIKILLPSGDYSALYSATLGKQTGGTTKRYTGPSKRDDAGYLTLGIWGWCIRNADSSQPACSHTAGWYSMNNLFKGVKNTGLQADDFNGLFVHLLILHGLAFLIALLACVPVGLSAWRQCRKKDAESQPGWFQHGTILAAAVLALTAWIVDKVLKHGVASNAKGYTVESSLGTSFVGGAALSLFLAFAFSTVPLMCQFIRNKHRWAASHSELQNATVLDEEERIRREAEEREKDEARQKRSEVRRERDRERRERHRDRRRRWGGRVTRYFGHDDDYGRGRR